MHVDRDEPCSLARLHGFARWCVCFFCILWNKIEHVFVAIVDDIFARAIETRHEVGLSLFVQQSGIPHALTL
jgi:hypothetical protein